MRSINSSQMLLEYKTEGMSRRKGDGWQFIAQAVRQFLKEKGILQAFSYVATPEYNAFIEALHFNLQSVVSIVFSLTSYTMLR